MQRTLVRCMYSQTAMPDDNSELVPPLPIPNRAVKRLSADDSTDYPCESRTLSGTPKEKKPDLDEVGFFYVMQFC